MPNEELITISDISREDFGSLCICAIRYCFGRRTYMPSIIQRIVTSNMKHLSNKDLGVIKDDIQKHKSTDYGDWFGFLCAVEDEINRRNEMEMCE